MSSRREGCRRRAFRAAPVRRRPLPRPSRSHNCDTHQSGMTNGRGRRTPRPAPNAPLGRCLPVGGDAAARERYQRTNVGVILRRMRSAPPCADDTRGHRLAAVEHFDVDPLRRQAHRGERLLHVCHEASRSAEVDICLCWDVDVLEDRPREVARGVEILTHPVARPWPAVAHIAAAVREREHEAADFGGEWMILPIASSVQPQDLPSRASSHQCVQHREKRGRPDSRAEQQHRPLSGLQSESSARRADVEDIARPGMVAQIGSGRPIRLDLHADSITLRRGGPRERVAAKQWRGAGCRLKPQDHVLTGQSRGQR